MLGASTPSPRGTGVQECALLPTEPLLGTGPLSEVADPREHWPRAQPGA